MIREQPNSEYQLCEEIGRGRFGVVYRCFSTVSGQSFACKSIDKRLLYDAIDRECLDKDPKILHFLSGHPHMLQIHSISETDNFLYIVTDLCDSPDLYECLNSARSFSESDAASVLQPLISAIAHCHRLGVAHRDIKPDNVVFNSRNKLKLADFGSTEWFGCNERGMMSGVIGTPYYVALEVLSGRDYNGEI